MKLRPAALFALLAFAVLGAAGLPLRADDVLPRPAAGDRYLQMADRSPFAPPTPPSIVEPPKPVQAGPKWSDQMSVTLLTQQGATYLATITDKAKGEHYLLQSGREDTEHQLLLMDVNWGQSSDTTTVRVSHNGDVATLRLEATAAGSGPSGAMPMPGRPPGMALPAQGMQPRQINPPVPPNTNNLIRRQTPIRTAPTVASPVIHPPPNVARRPVVQGKNEDDDDEE